MKRRTSPGLLPLCGLLVWAAACAAELDNPEDFVDQTAGGGAGMAGSGGSSGGGTSGAGGTSGNGGDGGGGGGTAPPCDAPAMVFAVPGDMGGCDGTACHQPNLFPPDLISPGVIGRLLDVPSGICNGALYIDSANPAGSYMLDKIHNAMPACGEQMPYTMPVLNATQAQCVDDWVAWVAGGGQ